MEHRILFLAWAPFFSGAERALLLTLRALEGTRYKPIVVVGTEGEFAAQVREMGVACEVAQVTRLERSHPIAAARAVAAIVRLARRYAVSVIHANDIYSYQPGGFAGRLLRLPVVTHLRFPEAASAYRWLLRPPFSLALFISHWFRASAIAEAPDVFGENSSTVIYDAVELPPVWTSGVRVATRRELGLPEDRPIIAMTGQVAEIKGIWEFIAAASLLKDTPAIFAIVGDDLRTNGEFRRRAEADVQARGLDSRFRFIGFRKDGPLLTQAFDVIAAPSHIEPFGLASLEGMAAQRPVVASRVGGIPEVVVHGHTGLLVNPKEPVDLARALRTILEHPAHAQTLARNGRERAATAFSLAVHRKALLSVYDRVLS